MMRPNQFQLDNERRPEMTLSRLRSRGTRLCPSNKPRLDWIPAGGGGDLASSRGKETRAKYFFTT